MVVLLAHSGLAAADGAAAAEAFDEELVARPLPDGALVLFANLTISSGSRLNHLELFPRALVDLTLASRALEVQLTLRSGQWLSEAWGPSPDPMGAGAAGHAKLPRAASAASWARVTAGLDALLGVGIGRLGSRRLGSRMQCEAGPGEPATVCSYDASDLRERANADQIVRALSFAPCNVVAGVGELLGGTSRLPEGGVLRAARHVAMRLVVRSQGDGKLDAQLSVTLVLPPPSADAARANGRRSNTWLDALMGSSQGSGAGGEGGGLHACPLARRSILALEMPRSTGWFNP